MTMLVATSFDHFGADETLFFENQVAPGAGGTMDLTTTDARWGEGRCLNFVMQTSGGSLSIYCQKTVPGAPSTIICGFAFWAGNRTASRTFFRLIGDDGSSHLSLRLNNPQNTIRITGPAGELETSTATIGRERWHWIELKATINDTTGSYDVRVDGTSIMSDTNVDTRNGGTGAVVDAVQFYMTSGNGNQHVWKFDDLVIMDDAGSVNNDFIGDARPIDIYPTAEGNYSAWTPSSGTDNSALVDETAPNDDTDYVSSTTVTDKDTYTHGGITPTVGTVYAVAVDMHHRKDDGATRTVKSLMRLSATDANGATHDVTSSYAHYQSIHETKPGGGSWTLTDVDNCEFGIENHA